MLSLLHNGQHWTDHLALLQPTFSGYDLEEKIDKLCSCGGFITFHFSHNHSREENLSLLLQIFSVKLENSPFKKLYVCVFQTQMLLLWCFSMLVARVLMFAQELLRFRYVRHIPLLSLASLCQDAAQPRIPPSASLQSPGCNTARWREILRILPALNMDENHRLIEEAQESRQRRVFLDSSPSKMIDASAIRSTTSH